MAEFAQPAVTRTAIEQQARELLEYQIAPAQAIDLAVRIFSRGELARAIVAQNPKPIKYSSALRRVERWFTRGAEARKPSRRSCEQVAALLRGNREALAQIFPQGLRLRLDAVLTIGGNPKYRRPRTGITVDFSADEAAALLLQAQEDPDEAWQTFFDVYVCPAGLVEQPLLRVEVR